MQTPLSGYVTLRISGRSYLGTWSALQKIIEQTRILRSVHPGFQIPVNHLLINGIPNNFPAVEFKRVTTFRIYDTNRILTSKPIRLYQAVKTEISDNHLLVLHNALVNHGSCYEQEGLGSEPYLYHL